MDPYTVLFMVWLACSAAFFIWARRKTENPKDPSIIYHLLISPVAGVLLTVAVLAAYTFLRINL